MDATPPTVIVTGAGLFGLTAAVELAGRGWGVRLMDPGPLPRPTGASVDVSKMVRLDYGADVFYTQMAAEAMRGWDEWNRRWDPPPFHEDGLLVLSRGGMGRGTFEVDSHETLTGMGHELQRVRPAELRRSFSAWNAERFPIGYLNPRGGWVDSAAVMRKLLREARRRGVAVEQGRSFARPLEEGGRVVGVRTTGGEDHRADHVVVAAGAWTPSLLPELRDVMTATGHPLFYFRVEDPDRWRGPRFPPWTADIARTGWYGFPALEDGTLKIGHHGPGRNVDPDQLRIVEPSWTERCRAFLGGALPELADAPLIDTRLCLYCDTFDGDFWIDRHPNRIGLTVAAGGSGHAFKFAPLLGTIVADVVEGKTNRWAQRFRWRPRGEERDEAARSRG